MGAIVDLARWMQTRVFKPRIFLLFALIIVGLWFSLPQVDLAYFIVAGIFSAVLLITFRLWDDLTDRQFDQANSDTHSKDRVLLTSQHLRPFVLLVCGLLLTTALALHQTLGIQSLAIYAALCIYTAFVYYLTTQKQVSRFLRETLILFKYPLFLLLLNPVINLKSLSVSLLLYAVLLAHWCFECRYDNHPAVAKADK